MLVLSPLLKYIALGGAIFYLVVYILIALSRMTYPYQLEWMEGGAVDHVRRILTGHQLYGKPSLSFTTFIYTPLYFYVSAIVTTFIGIGFAPLRCVSFASSLGCFIIIFLFVKRETRCIICSMLSVGFFAATFHMSGAWFDIARVDSLFLLLLLVSIYVFRGHTSDKTLCFAGILIGLSFLTKQTALVIALPLNESGCRSGQNVYQDDEKGTGGSFQSK